MTTLCYRGMGIILSVFGVNVSTRKLHFKWILTLCRWPSTPRRSPQRWYWLTWHHHWKKQRDAHYTHKTHTHFKFWLLTLFLYRFFFGSGGHFVNKVCPGNALQNSYHWASSKTITLLNFLVMKMKIIGKGCQSTADYMPWDYIYVNPVITEVQKLLILLIVIFSALPLPLIIFSMEGRYCCGAFPHLNRGLGG